MLTHVGEDGSVKTDGRQNLLKQSGFYPQALGKAIVQAWQQKGAWQPPIHKVQPPIEDPWSDRWGDAPPCKKQKHMDTAAKQLRTHGMTHGVSKAPVLMIHGLTCRVGE